ncbi:MAG: protein kinase [Anaerolineae bacterium]|nr:protein kinase [Anaerolineae bacterium]
MTRLGKYEILEEIGRGGFAAVYKAYDPGLNQAVAVKVLHELYTGQPSAVQRFLNEARKAVKLRHRGIVRIYAVDEDRGLPYIAMEYLPGGTLADRLHGEPLPLDNVVAIVGQVAAALDHAHQRGLVHRDVKPANILFDEEGHAVLVDFGLVKSLSESGLTSEGTLLGTPHYMAPEQAKANTQANTRSDVYALGVVAYEMLTGRVPFEADAPLAVLNAHVHDTPPNPHALNRGLDRGIAAVVLKALKKVPAKRYQSAGAFATALRNEWARLKAEQEERRRRGCLANLLLQGKWGARRALARVRRALKRAIADRRRWVLPVVLALIGAGFLSMFALGWTTGQGPAGPLFWTKTPTATATAMPTPTATPTVAPTATPTPTVTPTATPTSTPTVTPTDTSTPSPTPTDTPRPTLLPTLTPSPTLEPTRSASQPSPSDEIPPPPED